MSNKYFLVHARVELVVYVEVGGRPVSLNSVEHFDFEQFAFNGEEAVERVEERLMEDTEVSVCINDYDLTLIGEKMNFEPNEETCSIFELYFLEMDSDQVRGYGLIGDNLVRQTKIVESFVRKSEKECRSIPGMFSYSDESLDKVDWTDVTSTLQVFYKEELQQEV